MGLVTVKSRILSAIAGLVILGAGTAGAGAATLVAKVNVGSQTMEVMRQGRVIHTWKVSTARRGYITPRGQWRPIRMHKMWYSRKYDNAPMPYAVFYYGGYAIHGTTEVRNLGRPVSHGCVRLAPGNARTLFNLVLKYGRANTLITIQR